MKNLLILLISLITLASCTDTYTVQRLSDGAILTASDVQDRNFQPGDTVCIIAAPTYNDAPYQVSDNTWHDTIYCHNSETYGSYCWEYQMAVVK